MPRDFVINTLQKATEEYNKEHSTNITLPIIFSINNVPTVKKDVAYDVKVG